MKKDKEIARKPKIEAKPDGIKQNAAQGPTSKELTESGVVGLFVRKMGFGQLPEANEESLPHGIAGITQAIIHWNMVAGTTPLMRLLAAISANL